MQDEKDFIKDLLNPKTQNSAFQKLVKDFQKPLYNHIRNMVLNHDDANDVLQNTFIKVYQYLKDFKGESKLFSWIYRIATNEAITFINNRAKRNGISNQEMQTKIVENLKSDVYFDGNEIELKLQKAINILPDKQQLVFKMRYYEEIKYEDMSEILGTSVGALKASYHIAAKKIEDFLKSH
ncbi:MAG: sigma-70 family RNA polymerase sigma factor [Flavobacterium sp.]|nr:sigma-70 family RNA polymerase sigma factor [Flavobacterium sp.]